MENKSKNISETITKGDLETLQKLISSGEIFSFQDQDGNTPITLAVLSENEDVLKMLIDSGLDVNQARNDGFSPLHMAAQNYLPRIVDLLIKAGAEKDRKNIYGNTALSVAVINSQGRGDVIRSLLHAGWSPEEKNDFGVSPLEAAKTIVNYDIKRFFE